MHIYANHDLVHKNTLGVHCHARYFVEIQHGSAIPTLRKDPQLSALPWLVIGGGSNLLLTQDVDALVLSCRYDDIQVVQEDEDNVWVSAGAGCIWQDLVDYTVERGWWGLETLALIPGKVGAAPVQNIGAYGSEVQDTISHIQAFDLRDGQRVELRNNECQFAYRDSIFKHELAGRLMIYRVTFRLRKRGGANLLHEPLYERLAQAYPQACQQDKLTPKMISDTVIAIRREKIPEPHQLGSAGSFFKNPVVSEAHFNSLQQDYASIPGHRMSNGDIKISAAWLIEQANWKGKRIGDAGTYDKHALILVNHGQATGQDIYDLSQAIHDDVASQFGVSLEREVVMW